MPPPTQYKVPALEKGLDILEALSADPIPLSLAELATRLERSSSELFRMLNCLEQRQYVARDSVSGKYRLSLKLYALSHNHSAIQSLVRAAQAPMQALTESVRESCHLSILDRGALLVVAQAESPSPIRLSIEVGSRFEPLRTVSGRLILCAIDADERRNQLERCESWLQLSQAKRTRWLNDLEKQAGQSYAEATSESIEGVEDIAALIGHSDCGLLAALTVTRFKPKERSTAKRAITEALLNTASQISASLGIQR